MNCKHTNLRYTTGAPPLHFSNPPAITCATTTSVASKATSTPGYTQSSVADGHAMPLTQVRSLSAIPAAPLPDFIRLFAKTQDQLTFCEEHLDRD